MNVDTIPLLYVHYMTHLNRCLMKLRTKWHEKQFTRWNWFQSHTRLLSFHVEWHASVSALCYISFDVFMVAFVFA